MPFGHRPMLSDTYVKNIFFDNGSVGGGKGASSRGQLSTAHSITVISFFLLYQEV